MNKRLLTAAPPIQGGYLENSTKLQRGGKTSGLTRLDNCLSNSDIDFPLLSSQFKDLNLQLHASTNVTNPYTFSIQGNKSFSAQLEPEVATYQITCGGANTYRPISSGAIGYSVVGWLNNSRNFGTLNPDVFKGAYICAILYATSDNATGFPAWQILVSKSVGNAITLETAGVRVTLPQMGTNGSNYSYTLQNATVEAPWYGNNTYELKLY